MKTLIIYYQLVGESDDTCHEIHYGYWGLLSVSEDKINKAVLRHANGKEVRRAWW